MQAIRERLHFLELLSQTGEDSEKKSHGAAISDEKGKSHKAGAAA